MNGITPQELRQRGSRPRWISEHKPYVYIARGDGEKRVLELIASCEPITAKALRGLLDISESTCERLIRRLKAKGLIVQKSYRGEYYRNR
jgi:predicted HTH transcriptional regulator